MQSQYHNLPCVRGVGQAPGSAFRARDVAAHLSDGGAELALDIAAAYPPQAGIASWRRTLRLVRGPQPRLEVEEDFRLTEPTDDVRLHLMAAGAPVPGAPGRIAVPGFGGGGVELVYDPEALRVEVEEVPLEDGRLQGVWGERLWRIVLRASQPLAAGRWRLTASAL
jgi:hypothetical protein